VDPLAEVLVVDTRSGMIDECDAYDELSVVEGNEEAGSICSMIPGAMYYPIYTG
jgi:hypothetical protein